MASICALQNNDEFNPLTSSKLMPLLLLLYFVYLIYKQAWIASMGCFGILLVMLGQIFRYHFWLYQIREKKLGKSFRDWLKSLGG